MRGFGSFLWNRTILVQVVILNITGPWRTARFSSLPDFVVSYPFKTVGIGIYN
jgi:hypothetical protein